MWGRKFSSVTLLFHLNRWITLSWAMVNLLVSNLGNPEFESSLMQRSSVRASSLLAVLQQCAHLVRRGPHFAILEERQSNDAWMTIHSCIGADILVRALDLILYALWTGYVIGRSCSSVL